MNEDMGNDLGPEPCQPIGCDNDIHISGCVFESKAINLSIIDFNDLMSAANVEDIPAVGKIINTLTIEKLSVLRESLSLLQTITYITYLDKYKKEPIARLKDKE